MDNYQALQVGVYGGRGNVIPYGPGMPYVNEAAVLAALPVGSVVYDMAETVEANRMKRIRYVAELNGPDTINVNYTVDVKTGVAFEFLFRDNIAGVSATSVFFRLTNVSTTRVFVFTDSSGRAAAQLRQVDGDTIFGTATKTGNINDGNWHKIRLAFTSTRLTVSIDGDAGTPFDISGWTGNTITLYTHIDNTADVRPCQAAESKVFAGGSLVQYIKMDESSGTTLANTANPSNPATLSDATAHAKTCVPLSLGG